MIEHEQKIVELFEKINWRMSKKLLSTIELKYLFDIFSSLERITNDLEEKINTELNANAPAPHIITNMHQALNEFTQQLKNLQDLIEVTQQRYIDYKDIAPFNTSKFPNEITYEITNYDS